MKKLITLTIILCISINSICYAYTKGPSEPKDKDKSIAELNGYSEEAWAKLMDNNLEYSEIEDLVHNFNPSIASGWTQMNDSANEIRAAYDIMNKANSDAQDNLKKAKAAGSTLTPQLEAVALLTKTFKDTYYNTYQKLNKTSSMTTGLKKAEQQLSNAVKQIMMGYCSVRANKRIMETMVSMYEESLSAYEAMATVGMATSTDILKAESDLLSALSSKSSLETTEKQLYSQLIVLCGWKAADIVNVGEVPEPDMAKIAAMNPETDVEKAIMSNSAIAELYGSDYGNTESGKKILNSQDVQRKGNIKANLETLYGDVLSAKAAYEGAKAGYESGQILAKGAKAQYDLGLTSKAQYLGVSIAAVKNEASFVTARDNLAQAILKYEAALDGDLSAE